MLGLVLHTAKKLRSTTTGLERVLVSVRNFNELRCCYDLNFLLQPKNHYKRGGTEKRIAKMPHLEWNTVFGDGNNLQGSEMKLSLKQPYNTLMGEKIQP